MLTLVKLLLKLHNEKTGDHKVAERTKLIISYKEDTVTLEHHILHLFQLKKIYDELEKRIKSIIQFPNDLALFSERSKMIEKDLEFLCNLPQISKETLKVQLRVLSSTNDLVTKMDKMTEEQIFMHYVMRILGDIYGGRPLQRHVTILYQKNGLYQSLGRDGGSYNNDVPGLHFYFFPPGTTEKFEKFINTHKITQSLSEERIRVLSDESYCVHTQIFTEITKEQTWCGAVSEKDSSVISMFWSSNTQQSQVSDGNSNDSTLQVVGEQNTGDLTEMTSPGYSS